MPGLRKRRVRANHASVYAAAGGGGFTPTSSESAAWLARATGITSDTDKSRYDAMITGMVGDGVWAKLDALYIFAAPDSTTAKLNLKSSSYTCTQTGTLTFAASAGYTGDGSSGYLNTGFNPSTNGASGGGQWDLNSATLGCYVLNNRTTPGTACTIGNLNSFESRFMPLQTGGAGGTLWSLNHTASDQYGSSTTARGSWLSTRTGASAAALYRNGSSLTTSTTAAGTFIDNMNIYIFACNFAGSPNLYSGDQMSSAYIGSGMNSTQAAAMMSRLNTFMTAYGINVY